MSNENISKALEIDYESKPKEIVVDKKQLEEIKKQQRETLLNTDFNTARDNLKDLINTGFDAVDGIMKVATAGDHPRAYEVAALLMKTVSEMNKDLIDIHKQTNEAEKQNVTVNNTTNNSIYVGSTTDLQNLLNQSRSQFKSSDEIVEVEGEDAE
jgi:hypothetical protein